MEDERYLVIAKMLQGEATPAEQAELEAWRRGDPANEAFYQSAADAWLSADALLQQPTFQTSAGWQAMTSRMPGFADQPEPTLSKKPAQVIPLWARYSIAAAAILLIGLFLWPFFPGKQDEIFVYAQKETQVVVLPDKSVVTLRRGARLSYPKRFSSDRRTVVLSGSAFFEVVRNTAQPFTVRTDAAMVAVLGTSFQVAALGATITEVSVATGRVSVTPTDSRFSDRVSVLTPGMGVRVSDSGLLPLSPSGAAFYWKDSTLRFINKPLDEVVATMSATLHVPVGLELAVPDTFRRQRVTISFAPQPIPEMLTDLCLITKTRWRQESGKWVIGLR